MCVRIIIILLLLSKPNCIMYMADHSCNMFEITSYVIIEYNSEAPNNNCQNWINNDCS